MINSISNTTNFIFYLLFNLSVAFFSFLFMPLATIIKLCPSLLKCVASSKILFPLDAHCIKTLIIIHYSSSKPYKFIISPNYTYVVFTKNSRYFYLHYIPYYYIFFSISYVMVYLVPSIYTIYTGGDSYEDAHINASCYGQKQKFANKHVQLESLAFQ